MYTNKPGMEGVQGGRIQDPFLHKQNLICSDARKVSTVDYLQLYSSSSVSTSILMSWIEVGVATSSTIHHDEYSIVLYCSFEIVEVTSEKSHRHPFPLA